MGFLYSLYQHPGIMVFGIILITIWSLVWKGLGLWFSGKNQQKGWFIAMLILNTAGLLPIIYLIWFRPQPLIEIKDKKVEEKKVDKKKSKKK